MRRFLAILLMALLAVNSFPLAAQARLTCRMTGQVMQQVAVEDDPHSCCAVQTKASGELELANRSCCDLTVTPGHAPLLSTSAAPITTLLAALPTLAPIVASPILFEIARSTSLRGATDYRGPPPSSTSPRAPPVFS